MSKRSVRKNRHRADAAHPVRKTWPCVRVGQTLIQVSGPVTVTYGNQTFEATDLQVNVK